MAGAILMVATGAIGAGDAVRAIDASTIVLLLVMMVLVAPLRLTGLFVRLVPRLPDPQRAWLTLASTLAGNLTILGSITNLIVIEGAKRRGVTVSFGEYARVGIPVTFATIAFGVWWLSQRLKLERRSEHDGARAEDRRRRQELRQRLAHVARRIGERRRGRERPHLPHPVRVRKVVEV